MSSTWISLSALIVLVTALVAMPLPRQAFPQAGVTVTVHASDSDIQKQIDTHSEGTTIHFTSGTYRLLSLQPKSGDTFLGDPGAVFNGSELLTFARANAKLWVAVMHDASPEEEYGHCQSGPRKNADGSEYKIACDHRRDLYRDDVPQYRVASLQEVQPGKWFFDPASRKIYIADDPAGHTIEIGETATAIHGNASNVTIRGLTIEKYAVKTQAGAIACGEGLSGEQLQQKGNRHTGWVIDNNTIRLNHYSAIKLIGCDGAKVTNNKLLQNGNTGVGGAFSDDVLVDGNEIAANNFEKYALEWEAGGAKFVNGNNLTFSNNYVHDNIGVGLWSDIDCVHNTYTGNRLIHNWGGGIFYEISYGATIENNIAIDNGEWGQYTTEWANYAQIEASASPDVTIRNNQVTVGKWGNGITVVQQNRGNGVLGPHWAKNVVVENNTITYLYSNDATTGASQDTGKFYGSILFDRNTYHSPGGANDSHWRWNSILRWKEFQALGQEPNGKVDSVIPAARSETAMR
jgi:parallel beta-helix repeat protein